MKALTSFLFASGLLSLTTAQVYPNLNPDDIDINIRQIWCTNQFEACPLLCEDQERVGAEWNDCDPDTLTYECVCLNGKSPNMTEYSMTIPFHLCQESINICVANCKGDSSCANLCFKGKKCGASDPRKPNSTMTTSTIKPTKTTYEIDPTSTDGSDPFDTSFGARITSSAKTHGLGVVVAIAFGVLGMM